MDTLSIVLILVALLVIVLVVLNFGNKKLANNISVLEQTIETKDKSIIYYMQTYEDAREAVMKDEEKEQNLQKSYQEITELTTQKGELETKLQQMETKVFDLKNAHKDVVEEVTEKIFMIEKDAAKRKQAFNAGEEEFLLRVDALEEDKESLQKELVSQQKEMSLHLDAFADLDRSKTLLETDFVESRAKHTLAIEAGEQAHAKIIEDVTEKIFVIEKNIAIKDANIVELEKKYEALTVQSKQKLEEYETTLLSSRGTYENFESEHKQYVEEKNQEIEELKANIATLKQNSHEDSERDGQNILSLENKLMQEVEKYAKFEQKYNSDISELEKEEEALTKLVEDNERAFRTYKEESIDKVSSLEKTLEMKNASLKDIHGEYENYQATSEVEINTLRTLNETLKKDDETLQIEYDAYKKEKDKKIELLKQDINFLESKYKKFDEEQSIVKKNFELKIEEYIHKVQMKDDALRTMQEEKEKNDAVHNKNILVLENSLNKADETYTLLKQETNTKVTGLEDSIKEREVEIGKLQNQIESLEIQYQDKITSLDEKMQSEREKHVHEQDETKEKLDVTIKEYKEEIAEFVTNLETEKNMNATMVEAFDKEREENLALKNKLEEELEKMTIEKETLLGTVEEQDEKIMILIKNHEMIMHKKQDQVSKLFEQIQKFSQTIKSNKTDYEALTQSHENTQSELTVVNGLLQKKEQEQKTLNTTFEAYKRKSQETEERHIAYQEEQEILLAQMEEVKNTQIDKLEEERKALDALRIEMKKSEKKAVDEKQEYKNKILESNQKLDTVTMSSVLKEKEIARLTTEKNQVELTLKEEIEQSEKMMKNLKLELDIVLEEKEALDEQFSKMEDENQSKLSEVSKLLDEKEKVQEVLSIAFDSYKTKSQQREESDLKEKETQEHKLEEERKVLATLRLEMNTATKTIALKESEIKTLSDKVIAIGDKAIQEVEELESEIKTVNIQKDNVEKQLKAELLQKKNLLKEQEKFVNTGLLHKEKVKQLEVSIAKQKQRVGSLEDENLQKNKALDKTFSELDNLGKLHDKTLLESKEEMTALLEKHNEHKRSVNEKLDTLAIEIENKSVELVTLQDMKNKGDSEIDRLGEMFQTQLDINEQNIIKFKEDLESKHKTIETLKASQEQINIPTIHSEVLDLLEKGVKKKKIAKKFDLSVMDIDFIIAMHKQ